MTAKKTAKKTVAPSVVKALPQEIPLPATITLTRSEKPRKGSSVVFTIPGVRGRVLVSRVAFDAEPPTTLVVVGSPFAAPRVTMTKEQRAAARASMTPLQKAQAARQRADRAIARAARLEAAAAR